MSRPLDENTPTSVDLVVAALMDGIRAGKYAPGQRLFAGDFADALAISRSPVREAFHLLAGQGVLDLLPNRGVEIRRLSHKHLVDMMDMLRVTGLYGMEIAIPKLDEATRRRLADSTKAVERAGRNRQPYEWFQELVHYHSVIGDIADNLYLSSTWQMFHLTYFNRMLAEKLPGRHWEQYIENYRQICAAYLSSRPERALKLFDSHMRWALVLLAEVEAPGNELQPKSVA